MIWTTFYLGNKEVNVYGAENIFPNTQRKCHGVTARRVKYIS